MAVEWKTYDVEIQIRDRLIGGIPIVAESDDRREQYENWLRGQGVENDPSFSTSLPEMLVADPEMPVSVEDITGLETGFRRNDKGLYLEARQIKALLREASQRLGLIKVVRGMRQVMQHDLHVRALDGTQRISLGVVEPNGHDQRPISVLTRQGPRTSIKRFEYVSQPTLHFQVKILSGGIGDGLLDEERLRDMLVFGGEVGLGADRSQGEGTYDLLSLTRNDAPDD